MKKLNGRIIRRSVERVIGRKKFSVDLLWEAFKQNNILHDLLRSDRRIMKHEVAIMAFNKGWDSKKVLNLWVKDTRQKTTIAGAAIPINPNQVICLLVYDVDVEELIRMTIQIHQLKAFL